MCTLLAKLAIGLSATVATGFYHLAAAPPASAATDVCGPGNFSSVCVPDNSLSPQSPATEPDPQPTSPVIPDPVPPVVPLPVIPDPVPPVVPSPVTPDPVAPPVVPSPVIPDPVPPVVPSPVIPDPIPPVVPSPVIPDPVPPIVPQAPVPNFNIYVNTPTLRATTIPEPGAVVGLLLTGAGIIYSGRKRNKQVGQQR